MDSEEKETIKVIDRRRFILDDDGEVHEREPEQKVVAVTAEGVELAEEPEPSTASAGTSSRSGGRRGRVGSFFRRVRERLRSWRS